MAMQGKRVDQNCCFDSDKSVHILGNCLADSLKNCNQSC